MKTTIRELKIEDYEKIDQIWHSSDGVGLSVGDSKEGVSQFLERNPGLSFVAQDEESIIGVILCGHDGRRGYIHHLVTDPDYRYQGIGKALVEQSLAQLEKQGIFKCHIFVFASNENAIAFWKKIAWKQRTELVIMSQFL